MKTQILLGSLGLIMLVASPASAGPPKGLKPHAPIVCKGNRDIKLVKRHIETRGDAITIIGNCDVVVEGSQIVAGGAAIKLMGNGDISITNSVVRGAAHAIHLMGNGTVKAKGTQFHGKISVLGNGEFKDLGGNTFDKRGPKPKGKPDEPAAEPPPAPGKLKKADPPRCVGSRGLTLTNRLIKTEGDGVAVVGSCTIRLVNCRVEAGANGVAMIGSGRVVLENTYVKGRSAVSIVGSGDVSAQGCQLHGGIQRVGTGKFIDKGGNTIK